MNGHVKPKATVVAKDAPLTWGMVYQELGAKPLPLCGTPFPESYLPKHGTMPETCGADHPNSAAARNCALGRAWTVALRVHGWQGFQALQDTVEVASIEIAE